MRRGATALAAALAVVASGGTVLAHGAEGGFVLLLPTRFTMVGAALAVVASFLLLAFAPEAIVKRLAGGRLRVFSVPHLRFPVPSLLSFLFLALLVAAGVFGSRDPTENPLPLVIWTLWWVGFTLLQALVGPLWPALNPWSGPLALLRAATRSSLGREGWLRLPERIGFCLAIALFFGFAWFELIDLAPTDPLRLAVAVSAYWLMTFVGMILFGETAWAARVEPFGIFFGLVGGMAPFDHEDSGDGSQVRLSLVWPGRMLLERPALPPTGILFVLLTLASVSFDGFSRTFAWLTFVGVNPLEFPGRSAVVISGSAGLAAAFIVLAVVFLLAVAAGCRLAGRKADTLAAAGRLVYAIVPIAIAFHAAHYLTELLVDAQYARIAASDPFGLGWNLFGTAEDHITMSFVNTFEGVAAIWNTQAGAIVAGHVIGIAMAHTVALRRYGDARAATLSQIPLAALMVAYTVFGLWLLATPRI